MTTTIKKLQFAEGTSVTQPTDLTISEVIKEFVQYADDAAYESANPGFSDGATYYNTTSDFLRTYRDGTWVDLSYRTVAQTLSNKTLGDSLTFTEIATPATPSAGLVRLYPKSDGNFYKIDDSGVEVPVGSGAGGSGEKNYITNPSAASAITGWTAVSHMTVARTATASELPREFTTASGIKITATDSQTQSTSTYVYSDFSLDDVDLSKKLKIQWSQKITGSYTAGQLAVVIQTQADRGAATPHATPTTTAIPAADGVFETYFDASTTATLSLVIRATADMTDNAGIVISDVVVGPGVNVQGAVVGPGIAYTPTITGSSSNPTKGTVNEKARWVRKGEYMLIQYQFLQTVAGAAGSGNYTFSIPSGHTIDTNKVTAGTVSNIGSAYGFNGTTEYFGNAFIATESQIGIKWTTGAQIGSSNVSLGGSDARIGFTAVVPIAEWAGSGTVNLGANNVEYAWNSAAWGDSGDTTSFGYGPAGVAFAATDLTNVRTRRVRFQTAIQATDTVHVEIFTNGRWVPFGNGGMASTNTIAPYGFWAANNGAGTAGLGWIPVSGSSTDVDVLFGRYASVHTGSTGIGWASAVTTSDRWRVVKSTAGAAVGFGAATAEASGLVSREASGTFTGSMSGGFSANPADQTYTYSRVGNLLMISVNSAQTGTSNATTNITISGVPAAIRPPTATAVANVMILDNNSYKAGFAELSTSGVITLNFQRGSNEFTASSSKGLGGFNSMVFLLR